MRKAQVTMFVIIGLVVLVILGIVFLRPTNKPLTQQASQDTARVTNYVQSCLQSSSETVLRNMGTTGGYTSTDKFKVTNDQRDTQLIDMSPQKIVLWHEIHSCDSNAVGCVANNRPPLCRKDQNNCPVAYAADTSDQAVSMQEQLEKGTQAEIKNCLQFDSAFPELSIKEVSAPKVIATIKEDNIQLSLDYPLTFISTDNTKVDLNQFSSRLDIRLPDLYRFAMKIQNLEIQTTFLENIFLHLQSIYSGANTQIPPIREVQLYGKDTNYWAQANVKDVIQQDLLPIMNFVQIINAKSSYTPLVAQNVDPVYAPYANGAYQYMTIKLDSIVVPYSARFEYPNTPMYLSINNGQAMLKPDTFGGATGDIFGKLTGLRFTQYKFKYDVAFPMVVHLYDPNAFDGKGYNFDFGLEANIRNNHPLNTSINLQTITANSAELDLSDPKQLVNHIYKVKAIDAHTKTPISKASIYYDCGNKFYMGDTNASGIWVGKLPYCIIGGSLQAQASDYVASSMDLQNSLDDGTVSQETLKLWPIRQKTILIYKRTTANFDSLIKSSAGADTTQYKTPLNSSDIAIVQITKVKNNPNEEDFPVAGMLRFGNLTMKGDASSTAGTVDENIALLKETLDSGAITQSDYDTAVQQLRSSQAAVDAGNVTMENLTTNMTLDLIPGTYELDGTLLYGNKVVIPHEQRCVKVLFSHKCYDLDAKNFTSWASGGVDLKGTNAVVFSEDDIYSDKNIVLYVAEQDIPTNWDQLEQYTDLDTYLSYGRITYTTPSFVNSN
jgi:hypothetical protein